MAKRETGWRLEVSYPFPKRSTTTERLDKIVEQAVGRPSWASGAGFGIRDMSFDFGDADEARAAALRVKKALSEVDTECETELHDDRA